MTEVNYRVEQVSPIDWLCANAPGFTELSSEERESIMHFVLLWSFFEAKALATKACARAIVASAKKWELEGRLKAEAFRECLEYFQNRYYQAETFTEHFEDLRFRKNDDRPLVEAVLRGNNKNSGDTVAALLIIVYRLRNNLFHGVKWAYGIRGQLENFTHANTILMGVLELDPP